MVISVFMMDIVDQLAPGCIIDIPSSPIMWGIKILDFVDEKKHHANNILRNVRESIEVSIRTLNELLNFVGGKLELSKCDFYIIK